MEGDSNDEGDFNEEGNAKGNEEGGSNEGDEDVDEEVRVYSLYEFRGSHFSYGSRSAVAVHLIQFPVWGMPKQKTYMTCNNNTCNGCI